MATTAVSGTTSTATTASTSTTASNKSTAAQIAAANKASAQSLINSLNAGSGVDVSSLAQNLVNAEKVPQENAINAKITANDHKVSGYSAVLYMLDQFNTSLADLKDTSDYNNLTVSGASSAYTLAPSSTAKEGDHTIQVSSIYQGQKTLSSTTFANTSASVTGTFSITKGGTTTSIPASGSSPTTIQELVDAVNGAGLGVSASLVKTGASYQMLLTGSPGAENSFTFTNTPPGNGTSSVLFDDPNLQNASDASIKVDGVSYTRQSNTLNDVIAGVTMTLRSPTTLSGNVSSTDYVSMTRDTAGLKTKFDAFVTAYNDAQSLLAEVSNPKSTLDTYGGTLVGDSTVRLVQSKLRNMFNNVSSTAGTNVKYMWQMGFSFDAKGVLSLDSSKLNDALTKNYDDVVKTLTGNQNNLSKYSPTPAGFFGDATYKINQLISATGPIATQSQNATAQNTKYQDQLAKLDTRMQSLLDRYTKQFASMQSFVGSVNSQKTSLKSTFDGMMAMYTNKG